MRTFIIAGILALVAASAEAGLSKGPAPAQIELAGRSHAQAAPEPAVKRAITKPKKKQRRREDDDFFDLDI